MDDEPGINGAITPRMAPEQVTTDTIAVESVDDYVKTIEEAGRTVALPKRAVPGIGYPAYCVHTEGNVSVTNSCCTKYGVRNICVSHLFLVQRFKSLNALRATSLSHTLD